MQDQEIESYEHETVITITQEIKDKILKVWLFHKGIYQKNQTENQGSTN